MTSEELDQLDAYDVVVVPFPFTDRDSTKRRPALVLSSKTNFNAEIGHSVLAMITSSKEGRAAWPLDTPIADLAAAGLPAPSVARMKLFTLDHRLILRRAGRLAASDQAGVSLSLQALLVRDALREQP
nr:type II toxin-antitoxin system PemK/MazF family toxin [Nevskia sp.]